MGGKPKAEVSFQAFNSFINSNALIDIGYDGVPWTRWGRRWKRRFVFDRRWMLKEDIGKVIGEAWQEEQAGSKMFRVKCKIKNVRMNLFRWSKASCCNARKHIEQVREEIRRMKEDKPNGYRIKLASLKRELADAYRREELYWSQKARVSWLKEGDKNTRFFHAKVMRRRKVNKINVLRYRGGEWCRNEEETKQEILDYFQQIFTTESPLEFTEILQGIPLAITEEMNSKMIRIVTEQEISQAVFSMHPNKSPGPDGFTSLIKQSNDSGKLTGMRIARGAPRLPHLFFVPENVDPTGNYADDNHTCRGHILHHMNDTLFDLCRTYESAR
ncbi:uncharacterized protein LOC113750541 [Coffea eugenioides]|uniref:uncharacterized protein LOC113750541 n=1 Tax=Coffea eugenioides TaxID=49369 RepID=UPI000F60C2E0|nr:uncharacterized protein LOC113750541 [Coffea eugenioides]